MSDSIRSCWRCGHEVHNNHDALCTYCKADDIAAGGPSAVDQKGKS